MGYGVWGMEYRGERKEEGRRWVGPTLCTILGCGDLDLAREFFGDRFIGLFGGHCELVIICRVGMRWSGEDGWMLTKLEFVGENTSSE